MRKWYFVGVALLVFAFIGATMPKKGKTPPQKQVISQPSSANAIRMITNSTKSMKWRNPAGEIKEVGHGFIAPKSVPANASVIAVNNVVFDTKAGEPRIPDNMRAIHRKGGYNYYIVKCSGPILESYKRGILNTGVKIEGYLPYFAYIVKATDTQMNKIKGLSFITWTGDYHPYYKVVMDKSGFNGKVKVNVIGFEDANYNTLKSAVQSAGGNIVLSSNSRNPMRAFLVEIDASKIDNLAKIPDVFAITHYVVPVYNNDNDHGHTQYQAGGTPGDTIVWLHNIKGQGQVINSVDTGINTDHVAFRDGANPIPYNNDANPSNDGWGNYPVNRKVVAYWPTDWEFVPMDWVRFGDQNGGSYHGSHTNGTTVGDSADPYVTYDGMAPKAKVFFQDASSESGFVAVWAGGYWDMYGGAYDGTNDSMSTWGPSASALPETLRPRISTNSWGDSRYGDYMESSYQLDRFMWYHKDWLFFFSAGNDGSAAHTLGSDASAKDVVTLGATDDNGGITSFSSRGYTDDGRLKPDMTAAGSNLMSVDGSSTTNYQNMSGTSMACPSAAGACLLVRQYFVDGWYPTGTKIAANDSFIPSGALLKAMMINGLFDKGGSGPDSIYGWGDISLDHVLYFADTNEIAARALGVIDNSTGLLTGEYVDYQFTVNNTSQPLHATLVWTDYPSSAYQTRDDPTPRIVNDLDLTLINPSGTQYQCADPNGGATPDRRNPVEDIVVSSPAAGIWTVRVSGYNVAVSPQPFALVVTYEADVGGVQGGIVSFDKPVYGIGDSVIVKVVDNNASSPLSVNVISGIPDTEVVSCSGTSGLFTGVIKDVKLTGASNNNDTIAVSQSDTIWAYYTDASPAQTCSTFARIDAVPFTITNVRATNIQATSADISWNTSEVATGQVVYGTSKPPTTNSYVDSNLVTDHSGDFAIGLTGLNDLTTYYYEVKSVDYRGNVVVDNNGGDYYSFTTPSLTGSDILVILLDGADATTPNGSPLPHLKEYFINAIEYAGWNYAWWQTSEHIGGEVPARNTMKEFKAVFAPNQDEYPPILKCQQETLKVYEENGGRIAFTSHDFLWHSWENSSDKAYDTLWMKNYCNVRYEGDIAATGNFHVYGVSGDPISDAFSGSGNGAAYTPSRAGADGDSLSYINTPPSGWDAGGSGSNVWLWDATNGYPCGSKWESGNIHGTAGDGVWGGYKTRTVYNGFVITQIDTTQKTEPTDRSTFINNELIWLIGHDHPDVSISSPTDGGSYTSSPISIQWTVSTYGGTSVDTTYISYSPDEGATWIEITHGHSVSSPYSWNVSGLQNRTTYQVKVRVKDTGISGTSPALQASDQTADFTINIPGNDNLGPRIIPSPALSRDPVYNNAADGPTTFVISATATDSARGNSNVQTAQWDLSPSFSAPTTMSAVDGIFDSLTEGIQDTIDATGWAPGEHMIYIRAQDNAAKKANNWGPTDSTTVTVVSGTAVELSQFTALSMPNGIKLYWRAESEAGIKSWVVERSLSKNAGFEKVGELSTKIGGTPHNYTFADNTVEPPKVYYYRLASVYSGNSKNYYPPIRVRAMGRPRPTVLAINSVHPNPFVRIATVEYQIPAKTHITLKVYDITGRCVSTLADNDVNPGYYTIRWNGKSLAAGVYYIRLKTDSDNATTKVLLLK